MTKYEDVKDLTTEEYFKNNQFSIDAFNKKYKLDGTNETYVQALKRVCDAIASVEAPEKRKYWSERWFDEIFNDWWHPAGSIMQGAASGKKISLMNCFSAETRFITEKGVNSFDEFAHGSQVKVLTNTGKFHPATVKKFGKSKLLKLTVGMNNITKEIFTTPDHRWRTYKGKNSDTVITKITQDLQQGDLIPHIRKKWNISQNGQRYICPLGIIHGLVFGDGYYNKSRNSCSLDLCGDSREFVSLFDKNQYTINEFPKRKQIRINSLPNYMKKFPDFKTINPEYILGFFVGWFAADGTFDKTGTAILYSTDLNKLEIIKDIIEPLGIYSSPITGHKISNPLGKKSDTCFRITLTRDSLFESLFLKSSHKRNYLSYVENKQYSKRTCWKVLSIENTDRYEDVWCVQVPEGENFTLQGGINTYNCTTISAGKLADTEWDNLESIFKNTAYTVAKTAAYRQGLGVDFSALRPRGAGLLNSAKESTGAVHWMQFIDSIAYYVGQRGRIPAMLFSLSVDHPDIEEFITVKSDYTKIQNANISVQCTNEFYKAVEKNADWTCEFTIPAQKKGQKIYIDEHSIFRGCEKDGNGKWFYVATQTRPSETITKVVKARKLLEMIAKQMTNTAEPGIQNIDIAKKYSNSDYVYNPQDEYDSRILSTNACLTGDTWVFTKQHGPLQIKDVVGKQIHLLLDGHFYSTTTDGFWPTGKKKIYEIELQNGLKIKATDNHRFMTNGQWKELKDLKVGEELSLSNNRNDIDWKGTGGTLQEGWLLGNLIGDGHFAQPTNSPKFAYWGENKEKMWHIAKKFLQETVRTSEKNREYHKEEPTEVAMHKNVIISSSRFREVSDKWGVTPESKQFNSLIEKGSSDFYKGIIGGLFDANGCVFGSHRTGLNVEISQVNRNNLEIVQRMLFRLGIESSIYSGKKPGKTLLPDGKGGKKLYNTQQIYVLRVKGRIMVNRFFDTIFVQDNLKKEKFRLKELEYTKNPYLKANMFKSSIVGINEKGEEMVFDCTVPDTNSFDANGFISHNCSEQYLSRESLCVLASANCEKFSSINSPHFPEEISKIGVSINRFLDNVNEYELQNNLFATPHQKLAIQKLRRTGAGFTNLCGWLLKQNLEYGTDNGNDATEEFMKQYNYWLYKSSEALGEEKGSFGLFDRDKFVKSPFIQRMMKTFPDLQFNTMRNVTCSSIAPTGTLSLMFRDSVLSYGIEPAFGLYYWKRTRISKQYEYYFIVPHIVREIFAANNTPLPIESDTIKDTWDGKHGQKVIDVINANIGKLDVKFKEATKVNPFDKLELMARVAKWCDSSISVTYMLPENSDWKDTYNFILEAYKKEVKSIAAFPDRKMYGIITHIPFKTLAHKLINEGVEIHAQNFNSQELKELNISNEYIKPTSAPKRPVELKADIYPVTVKGEKYLIAVGLLNGAPFEIMGGKMNDVVLNFHHREGKITKLGRGKYRLEMGGDIVVEDFAKQFTPVEQLAFRLMSGGLRHGWPIHYIVQQLEKSADDITSFASAAARILKKYIKDGAKATGMECPHCHSHELFYHDGCVTCSSCQWSKCS